MGVFYDVRGYCEKRKQKPNFIYRNLTYKMNLQITYDLFPKEWLIYS